MTDKKKAVSITVPSKDPKKDDGKKDGGGGNGGDKEVTTLDGVGDGVVGGGDGDKKKKKKTKGGKDILEPEELSEEDKALKEGLELAVTRVDDSEPGIGESSVSCLPPKVFGLTLRYCRYYLVSIVLCLSFCYRLCCWLPRPCQRHHRAFAVCSRAATTPRPFLPLGPVLRPPPLLPSLVQSSPRIDPVTV